MTGSSGETVSVAMRRAVLPSNLCSHWHLLVVAKVTGVQHGRRAVLDEEHGGAGAVARVDERHSGVGNGKGRGEFVSANERLKMGKARYRKHQGSGGSRHVDGDERVALQTREMVRVGVRQQKETRGRHNRRGELVHDHIVKLKQAHCANPRVSESVNSI